MKKVSIVSIIALLFLMISSFVGYYTKYLNISDSLIILGIAGGVILVSAVLAFVFRKNVYINIICLLMGSIALGLCIRTWYIYRGFDNPLWVMLLVSLASVVHIWIFYFLLYIPFFEKHCGIVLTLYIALSLIAYIIVICLTKTTYVSTFGYYMIVQCSFLIGSCIESNSTKQLIRNMTLSSFSVVIVILIIGLLILSEGDFSFDFSFDLPVGDSFSSPHKKKVK